LQAQSKASPITEVAMSSNSTPWKGTPLIGPLEKVRAGAQDHLSVT
jgi:hypothetical protein